MFRLKALKIPSFLIALVFLVAFAVWAQPVREIGRAHV